MTGPSPQAGESFAYPGNCSICGQRAQFVGRLRDARNSFPCPGCGATHRFREQAAAILTLFARGRSHFLAHFARQAECRDLAILEYALASPFARRFGAVADYHRAGVLSDLAPGEMRHGVACQTLERLTYPDARFDLVITSDVMEHLFGIEHVIAEVGRVLRPGGAHVFSAPLDFPLAGTSAVRARLGEAGISHTAEPRYEERLYDDPALVVNEFGADLIAMHARHRLHLRFHRGEPLLGAMRDNAVAVARKLP